MGIINILQYNSSFNQENVKYMNAPSDNFEQHPLGAICPRMPKEDFADLCDDIGKNGLINDIITYQGQILDGWHRYQACLRESVRPKFAPFAGDNPADYVISTNVYRRQLSKLQKGTIILEATEWKARGGKSGGEGTSVEQLSKTYGISESTLKSAKKAIREGKAQDIMDGTYRSHNKRVEEPKAVQETPEQRQIKELQERVRELEKEKYEREMKLSESLDMCEALKAVETLDSFKLSHQITGLKERIRGLEHKNNRVNSELNEERDRVKHYKYLIEQHGIKG